VALWTAGFHHWHDELIRKRRTDGAALVDLAHKVVERAQRLRDNVMLTSQTDIDEYDEAPLMLFLAHMLVRHQGGPSELATRCYEQIKVRSAIDCQTTLQKEFAEFLARTRRLPELNELCNEGGPFSTFDLIEILSSLPSDTFGESSLEGVFRTILDDTSALTEIDEPMHLALLAHFFARLGRPEAETYAKRTCLAVADQDADTVNNVIWRLYLAGVLPGDVVELGRRAYANAPEHIFLCQTFIAVLVRTNQYEEALPHLRYWAATITPQHFTSSWPSFIDMFRDFIRGGRAIDVADILLTTSRTELWQDLALALKVIGGTRVQPSLATPQTAIYIRQLRATA
jgi:hypothetical protein